MANVTKKILLAPVRAAFDVLLRLNFRDFAGRFKKAILQQPTDTRFKVESELGYDWNFFQNQVNAGASKKPLFGSGVSGAKVGVLGTVATAVIAAAPAIIIAVNYLKTLSLGESSDTEAVNIAVDDVQKQYFPENTPQPSGGFMQIIKDNPIPATLVGTGILFALGKAFKVIK